MLSVPRPSPNWKSLMSLMYYIHKEHQHFLLMWCAVFSPSFCLIYSIVNGDVSLVILIPSLLISEDMFKRCQGNAKKVHLYFARSPMLVFVNCGRFLNTKTLWSTELRYLLHMACTLTHFFLASSSLACESHEYKTV